MTDNDIIKALERCKDPILTCEGCPLERAGGCVNVIIRYALDLINRQKAEIERLHIDNKINQKLTETWKDIAHRETGYVKIARAEAIKEFAEKLKEKVYIPRAHPNCSDEIIIDIDNLVKEMTEDNNA